MKGMIYIHLQQNVVWEEQVAIYVHLKTYQKYTLLFMDACKCI